MLGMGDIQREASRPHPRALPARSTTERLSIRSSPMVQLQISTTSQFINEVKKELWDTTTHGEEGDIENDEVQGHAQGNSCHKELVLPKRQAKQAFVLGQRVHRVEHFDCDQD